MLEYLCHKCGRLLFKALLIKGSKAEGYCKHCKKHTTFIAS